MKRRHPIDNLWWVVLGFVAIAATMLGTEMGKSKSDPISAEAAPPNIMVVYKSPTCSCCSKWVEHLRKSGFRVEVHDESEMSLVKTRLGVPEELASCHTAIINGYVIEGHVPADDIKQLLATRPKAKGLAVPGMPAGSPGMEMGTEVDSYNVMLIGDGQAPSVFSHHGPSSSTP